ncbi:sensor histidine kinase [Microbacterium thalli]|uniref:sensor histidine kinase n=1 Tax=Microbacterium thalli TaxID=3027921 RepID=UPI0023651CC5|nr:histidine kinase [Microbacterium thalli]MDD7929349.1 histidine kinase [Microbacterium thalli]
MMAPSRRRPDAADTAILAGYLVIAAALGYLSVESTIATPLWPLVLLAIAGTAVVLVSRRRPAVAFGAAIVLMLASFAVGSGAEAALVIAGLYRAGVRDSRGAWIAFGWAAAGGTAAALMLALRVRSGPPLLGLAPRADAAAWATDWLSITVVVLAASLIATLLGINAGHGRRQAAALAERAEHLRRERDQEASIAAAAERERIAREMHDVIAHSLAVMVALADGAQASVNARPDEAHRAIGRVSETGRRTLGEVRRLLTAVRDERDAAPPAEAPRVERIPALVDEFRAAGIPVRLEQTGSLTEGAAVSLTIYRIVQEALTNVLRHGRGVRDVLVQLVFSRSEVTILVKDVAAPTDPAAGAGRGLVGIRERAAFYDGSVEAGPVAGGGWRVFVRLSTEDR